MQHRSINDPACNRLNKLGVWNRIEVATQVCVYNFMITGVNQLVDASHRIKRAAVPPVGILLRRQVRLENRFEHQHRRRFPPPGLGWWVFLTVAAGRPASEYRRAGPAVVDKFDSSAPAPVHPASVPPRTLRCPGISGRPLPPLRRCHGSPGRRTPACPCGTPCRTVHRSESRMPPWLLRAAPSATSEHLVGLLGSSPIPRSLVALCARPQLRPLPSPGVTRLHW